MLTDQLAAKTESKKYEDFSKEKGEEHPLDFKVQVLTFSYWPTYKKYEVQIPPQIKSCIDSFNTFYHGQQTSMHKQLTWCYSHGSAIITGGFTDKNYDFVVSTLQMCILLLFNDH
jgi:hypothetical protein